MNAAISQSASSAAPAASVSRRPLVAVETMVLIHVATLVVFCTWAFGANAYWSRIAAAGWASIGALFTLAALRGSDDHSQARARTLRYLWPLGLLNVLVVASWFNPSFRSVTDGSNEYFVAASFHPWLPSSARPDLSLRSLWFFDAVYLSCFNLLLWVRQRQTIRSFLLVLAANAVLLAIFGTIQKLLGASAPYFATDGSRQPFFFATFLYHNHWGAFALLMISVSAALVYHFARRGRVRDFWHSPGFAALVAVALLALTVPLSGSRSSTVLLLFVLAVLLGQWCLRSLRSGARGTPRIRSALLVAGLLLAGTLAFAYDLARPVIEARIQTTYQQVRKMQSAPAKSTRPQLYADTWRMASERPWFGWGLGSYRTAFVPFNSLRYPHPITHPHVEVHFRDAHSDWLQSIAEIGFIGTASVLLCACVPLWPGRRALARSWFSGALLTGIATVLLYAAVEFPFGNGAVIVVFWLCFFCALQYARAGTEPQPEASI